MLPFGNLTELLKMAIDMVIFSINSMVIFHGYVRLLERIFLDVGLMV